MRTIAEMKETARTFLLENGFVEYDHFHNCDSYYIPAKANIVTEHHTRYDGIEYDAKYFDGLTIEVRETYRSNGTAENQSIYFEVTRWNASTHCGRVILREKLYSKHGAKKTASILQKVLEAYNG